MVLKDWKRRLTGMLSGESRRQLFISIFALAASGLFSTAIRFVGGIIQGRFIGPETLGYYTKFTILPGYIFFLHLGVFTSFARQYPYFIGKKDKETALLYAGNALGWTFVLIAVHSVVFGILSLVSVIRGDWAACMGWGTQIVVSATTLYMLYMGSTYRNSGDFVQWSRATALSSVVSLLLLPLVAFYHFVGLCIRYSAPDMVSALYAHVKRPIRTGPRLDREVIQKMIAFGAPLMVFAYISTYLWTALERTYILHTMNERSLGLFAFAGTLSAALVMVSRSISQVFNPRIAMLYGSSGKNMKISFRYCMKCSVMGSLVMLPLIGLSIVLIEPLLKWILPRYLECAPLFRCLCWLSLIPVIDLPKQLLIVAKKTRQFGISVLAGFTSLVLILLFFVQINSEMTLERIAAVSVLCKMISVVTGGLLAWHSARFEAR